ncbi:Filament-like plant protein 3 [Striga hermonthica]|uniref:Filament-like plant protein 3 n=1 Tax=Striga hermonthica TaxID=68872 RepID=A0A9N7NZZ5_STRHE|nr:Filament-like plant protein 3 [Striga hermonthica]
MEKRKWPWKKKSSERSPGESESSGSFSSHSERYSDEQEVMREQQPTNDKSPSSEVTSKATSSMDDEVHETVKSLTQKLSAALVNLSVKEDLVKQHAKVAEEAVAGWEKAENEVASLKHQLEAALQQNMNLEVRASHLDGALKECVRQLRQSKDEQEKRISDAVHEKSTEWESHKAELEQQILHLQNNSSDFLESLERENTSLRQELGSCLKELEIVTVERDLSTRAAESASKLQLESIKKIARLEAECRKLQSNIFRKSPPLGNHKSSFYAESLIDSCKSSNTSEQNCSDFDLVKNERHSPKNLAVEIDMMDDFLEMERLVALPKPENESSFSNVESTSMDNPLRGELDLMTKRVDELENELKRVEMEKLELQKALDDSLDSLKVAECKMKEVEIKLEEVQKEFKAVNEMKELLEFKLVGMEAEARTHSANVESLRAEVEGEKKLSAQLSGKCRELESELTRRIQEYELVESINLNAEPKVKQEDIAVAADKLAECQKTIASLGRQLESLATLEDFLIDTSSIPGLSKAPPNEGDAWGLTSKDSLSLTSGDLDHHPRMSMDSHGRVANRDEDLLPTSSSNNHIVAAGNGFGKFFSRSMNVIELGNSQD